MPTHPWHSRFLRHLCSSVSKSTLLPPSPVCMGCTRGGGDGGEFTPWSPVKSTPHKYSTYIKTLDLLCRHSRFQVSSQFVHPLSSVHRNSGTIFWGDIIRDLGNYAKRVRQAKGSGEENWGGDHFSVRLRALRSSHHGGCHASFSCQAPRYCGAVMACWWPGPLGWDGVEVVSKVVEDKALQI